MRRRSPGGRRTARLGGACALLLAPLAGAAQQPEPPRAPSDTLPYVTLDALVVTGARTAVPLGTSVVAITRLTARDLDRLAGAGFAETLRMVPGFALVDFDGTGFDPQLAVRGFYGGGEAEYVVVLLDGQPLNDLQTGLMAWDIVPSVAVRSVEVVRGGASALWGDAAMGGVINLVTRGDAGPSEFDWELEAGGHGGVEGGARLAGTIGDGARPRTASIFAWGRRQDGFREHAEGAAATLGGALDLVGASPDDGGAGRLSLSVLSAYRDLERPGPLSAEDLAADRSSSHVFYRFDGTEGWVHRGTLDGRVGPGLSGSLAAELRRTDQVRTLPLAPDFADTKARDLNGRRLLATLRHESGGLGLLPHEGLVVGLDASLGAFESDHYEVVAGPAAAYAGARGARGGLDAAGAGSRRAAAAFVQYEARPAERLRVSLGARSDWLRDRHVPRVIRGEPASGEEGRPETRTHRAVSPRAGLNLRYLESDLHRGHVYLTAGRSFKAPTLDQLFDQRSIPLPFPPYSATTANPALEPQDGTHVELGLYHRAVLRGALAADLSVSLYRMELRDELDFDVETLRYVNIGRSRHDGVELGLTLSAPGGSRLFANWALQAATQKRGEHAGRRLKAIPRHFVSAGWSGRIMGATHAGLFLTRATGVWLDDRNTIPLEAHTRVDARLGWTVAGRTLFVEARNLLDARYSTTGFPDPSGADLVYYHPAAGRTLRVGVRSR